MFTPTPWGDIAFQNGIFSVQTGEFTPFDNQRRPATRRPLTYQSEPTIPCWQAFVRQLFRDHPNPQAAKTALLEFIGYCLMDEAPLQTVLLATGPSNSGLSVLAHFLTALVNDDQLCQLPAHRLDDPRVLSQLHHKTLNLMRIGSVSPAVSGDGLMQLLQSHLPITAQYGTYDYRVIFPNAKHVMLGTDLPVMDLPLERWADHCLYLPVSASAPGTPINPTLPYQLRREVNAIATAACHAIARVFRQNGRFTGQDESVTHLKAVYRKDDPVFRFISTQCEPDPASAVLMESVRVALKENFPETEHWTDKRITQGLKHMGCKIKMKRYQDKHARHLLGYRFMNDENDSGPQVILSPSSNGEV